MSEMDPALADDAQRWLALLNRLETGRAELGKLPRLWRWPYRKTQTGEQVRQEWQAYVLNRQLQIEAVCDRWLAGESVLDLAAESLELFRIRFDPAMEFVERHVWMAGDPDAPVWQTFLPFPDLTIDEAARQFLTQWWHHRGADIFFDQLFWDWVRNA